MRVRMCVPMNNKMRIYTIFLLIIYISVMERNCAFTGKEVMSFWDVIILPGKSIHLEWLFLLLPVQMMTNISAETWMDCNVEHPICQSDPHDWLGSKGTW